MASDRDHIGNIATHLQEQMRRTTDYLKGVQKSPMGTKERGRKQLSRLWTDIQSMDTPERDALMSAMAERAGHEPGEKKPCEVCRFVARNTRTD